jgi:hypothetical protein
MQPAMGQTPTNRPVHFLFRYSLFDLPTSTWTLLYRLGSVVAPYFFRRPSYQGRSYSDQNCRAV